MRFEGPCLIALLLAGSLLSRLGGSTEIVQIDGGDGFLPAFASTHPLLYSTFVGASTTDWGTAVALAPDGEIYVAGTTFSRDFPVTPGAFDQEYALLGDGFVAKFSPDGRQLLAATFIGGNDTDVVYDLAVDASGNPYVTGLTFSQDFPITPGSLDASYNLDGDAFVVRLASDLGSLSYSTFLGVAYWDRASAIRVDESGRAIIAGGTQSPDFPVTPGAFDPSHNGDNDAFVAELAQDGSALVFSTFLGGNLEEVVLGLELDDTGILVGGSTRSSDFPTTPGAFDRTCGTDGTCDLNGVSRRSDGFVAKLSLDGGALVYLDVPRRT